MTPSPISPDDDSDDGDPPAPAFLDDSEDDDDALATASSKATWRVRGAPTASLSRQQWPPPAIASL